MINNWKDMAEVGAIVILANYGYDLLKRYKWLPLIEGYGRRYNDLGRLSHPTPIRRLRQAQMAQNLRKAGVK